MIGEETGLCAFVQKDTEIFLSGGAFSDILKALLVERKNNIRFQAKGFSMAPFIKDGDIVTVAPILHGYKLNFGDLVVINKDVRLNKIALHRIIGKPQGFYLIKGDNNYEEDGLIPIASILGKVIKVERNGKRVFFGLGQERFIIAFLSRCNILIPLLFPLRVPIRFIRKLFRPIVIRQS